MAKKFSKLVMLSALAGAAAAGTYYYLQKKNYIPEQDADDIDDFDDFDDDLDDDFEDTSIHANTKNRSYVSLDLDSAKEIIGEKAIETLDKAKEKIEHFNVSEKIDKAKEIIEEMTNESTHVNHSSVSSTYNSDDSSSQQASSCEEFFDDTDEV